ncbi:MAG: ferrous iron transport protein B [Bacteroidota bacterium]
MKSVINIPHRVALIGNPNSGKTTLFNALTGLKQKVGNYPGVTIEKKEGKILFEKQEITLLDLPGTYSLTPHSPDEKIACNILLGKENFDTQPQAVICVVDASNLERNLFLATQIIDMQIPVVIALTMTDVAENMGVKVNAKFLSDLLGVPVVVTLVSQKKGLTELTKLMMNFSEFSKPSRRWRMQEGVENSIAKIQSVLEAKYTLRSPVAFLEALQICTTDEWRTNGYASMDDEGIKTIEENFQRIKYLGFDRRRVAIDARYSYIHSVCSQVVEKEITGQSLTDKLDKIFTHKFFGFIIFFGMMGGIFHAIFSFSEYPMNLINLGIQLFGEKIANIIPHGDFQDLLINGALSGVGAVITFLPQILLLFFFLSLLEDTGYMARAAFIMDRVMAKFGLHGKSFIPLLSSFGCAVPGIMATRTIENERDRIATIMVAPLMSCSARLPVYTLLIAAFIPPITFFGFFPLTAIVMFSLYIVGIVAALCIAIIFKKTLLKGKPPLFLMELPSYKFPSWKSIFIQMWERSILFLKRAGTFILGVSIILWFLATYPKLENQNTSQSERLEHSFAGRAGHLIEPIIAPLGFDWKIGIGLISSLLQREVFVSTMGTIYNIDAHRDENTTLIDKMRNAVNSETGEKTFTPLVAISLMVYYVLAMQCFSTVAVTKRETNSWKWAMIQVGYMSALAYICSLFIFQFGKIAGLG